MSVGCVVTSVLWVIAFGAITLGWMLEVPYVAHLGLATSAAAATMTIIRDNQQTRRQIYATLKRNGGGGGSGSNVANFVRPDERY